MTSHRDAPAEARRGLLGRDSRRGFTLIELLAVVAVVGLLIALLLPAVQAARETARRAQCSHSLRQFGIALNSYAKDLGWLPAGSGGRKGYSIHCSLLPYLENASLYQSINFSVHPGGSMGYMGINFTAATTTVATFLCPSDAKLIPGENANFPKRTNYDGSTGYAGQIDDSNGIFSSDNAYKCYRFSEVTDGSSQTIAMSECVISSTMSLSDNNPITAKFLTEDLTEPNEFEAFATACRDLNPLTAPLRPPNQRIWFRAWSGYTLFNSVLTPGQHNCINGLPSTNGSFPASSNHPGGVNALFLDGHVQFIKSSIDISSWRALSTRAGGEVIPNPD